MGRLPKAIGWAAAVLALAATYWAYTRPNLVLDFGMLMQLCGFR